MKFDLFCRREGDHGCLRFLTVELAILLKKLNQWWIISTIWVMYSFGKRALSKTNVMGLQVSILWRSFAVLEFKGNSSSLQECFYLISTTNNVTSCFCHMHLPSAVDTANLLVLDVVITLAKYMHHVLIYWKYFCKNNKFSAINKWEYEQNLLLLSADFGKSIEHLLSRAPISPIIPSWMNTLVYIFRLPITLRIGRRGMTIYSLVMY